MHTPGRHHRPFTSVALRQWLLCAALACTSVPTWAALFDDVGSRARQLATEPFKPQPKPVAEKAAASDALTYDQYRDIRFRPDHSLWRAEHLPFEVQFFHPGFVNTPFGLLSGRHSHSPVPVSTIRPSESCTSGRKSPGCG